MLDYGRGFGAGGWHGLRKWIMELHGDLELVEVKETRMTIHSYRVHAYSTVSRAVFVACINQSH